MKRIKPTARNLRHRLLKMMLTGVMTPALAATAHAGDWVAGDFHQHTTYTDGSNPLATVMFYNNHYGLDWWANSEHGGVRSTDGFGPILTPHYPAMDTGSFARFWDNTSVYPAGTILGDVKTSGGHQQMWRWQSLCDYSFPDVLAARTEHTYRAALDR